jgi:hypothetical protein
MKIGRLKQRADELAGAARADRLDYKSHADRALVIVRRRVGSTTGLAVSFSLGFMAGTGTAGVRTDGVPRNPEDTASDERHGPTFIHQLAHGPVGEAAMKLGVAMLARSLMKLQQDGTGDLPPSAQTAGGGDISGQG